MGRSDDEGSGPPRAEAILRGFAAVGFGFTVALLACLGWFAARSTLDPFAGDPGLRIEAACPGVERCGPAVSRIDGRRGIVDFEGDGVVLSLAAMGERPVEVLLTAREPLDWRTGAAVPEGGAGSGAMARQVVVPPGARLEIHAMREAGGAGDRTSIEVRSPRSALLGAAFGWLGSGPTSLPDELLQGWFQSAVVVLAVAATLALVSLGSLRSPAFLLAVVLAAIGVNGIDMLDTPTRIGDQDLREFLALFPAREPWSNLGTGPAQAWSLLRGHGLTSMGVPPWHRMPGYGLFGGLACAIAGGESVLDCAVATVWANLIAFAVAVGVFALAVRRIAGDLRAWIVSLAILWLPRAIGLSYVDTLVPAAALLVLAGLCGAHRKRLGAGAPDGRSWAELQVAFLLWFLLRPDVLPGWTVLSGWLARRRLSLLVWPLVAILVTGASWGLYKRQYTGEFAPTVTSVGESLFCGLWDAPHWLGWKCSDTDYTEWVVAAGGGPATGVQGNGFATAEVLRFWGTYPLHVVVMVSHKVAGFFDGEALSSPGVWRFSAVTRWTGLLCLSVAMFALILVALGVGYERELVALLSWPLLLQAPAFFVMMSSDGRFYGPAAISLVAVGALLATSGAFWRRAWSRPRVALLAVFVAVAIPWTARRIETFVVERPAWHRWAPIFSPQDSSLVRLSKPAARD